MELDFEPVVGTCSMLEMITGDGTGRFESAAAILYKIKEYNRSRQYFTPYKVIMYNSRYDKRRMRMLREAGFKQVLRYRGNDGVVYTMMKVMPPLPNE